MLRSEISAETCQSGARIIRGAGAEPRGRVHPQCHQVRQEDGHLRQGMALSSHLSSFNCQHVTSEEWDETESSYVKQLQPSQCDHHTSLITLVRSH